MIQMVIGSYERAFSNLTKSLEVARNSGNRTGEGLAFNALGSAYLALGQPRKAIDYFEKALAIAREIKNRNQECMALATLGFARQILGEYAKSIEELNHARSMFAELKTRVGEPSILVALGMAHSGQNQPDKAIEYFEQALALARETKSALQEALALLGLTQASVISKQYDKARVYCDQGLAIARAQKSREAEAGSLAMLMSIWIAKGQPELAIIFGKQSINILQRIRLDLRDLDKSLQQSFLQDKKNFYRTLADLLAERGRLPEAQQVLNLLKEEEYYEFVRRDAAEGSLRGAQINFTPAEAGVEKQFAEVATRVAELGAQRAALLTLTTRTAAQEKQLSELETKLEAANQAFQKFLDQLAVELKQDKPNATDVTTLRESQTLMDTLRELNAVAVYTIVGKDKYRVILITPDVQKAYEYSITEAELNKKVFAFREVLQNPNLDPVPQARELYRILIGPELARDIGQTKIQTIMWSLDGTLRYLPVSALHDGSTYLVESYRNVVFTLASRDHLKDPVSPKWQALGVGVSREREVTDEETKKSIKFPALPGVREELGGIVRQDAGAATNVGVLDGRVMLDESFTADALRSSLRLRGGEQPYKVVHIASHFNFQPGDETKSFLLLGDGTLTLARLKGMSNLFSKVELLTLSACNTATGDSGREGKEVEGFAVLAQRQGAEAIIATLWPVSDPSTSELMRQFYRLREEKAGTSKAEALRQAQLRLLKGTGGIASASNSGPRSSTRVETGPSTPTAAPFKPDPNAKYSHPYYWAPFILIGNWK
jgi:CHAT domain-containing protein/Tfp pilus assembly protein PilF